jgi:hypothetical protein
MQQLFFPLAIIGRLDAQPNHECFQQTSHFALGNSSLDGRQKQEHDVRERNEECIEERGEPFLASLHPRRQNDCPFASTVEEKMAICSTLRHPFCICLTGCMSYWS